MAEERPSPAERRPTAAPWPQAGTSLFDSVDPAWRHALIERFANELERHVVGPWFPRSIEAAEGGFWQDWDRRWRRIGDGTRMLEFQARQTRTAARLGLARPAQRERWSQVALHGMRYLRGAMADAQDGGWYWLIDRAGRPLHGATKHAHGVSYLVGAATEVYRLTGSEEALQLARDAVAWLERVHHDDEHGGYHGWVTRDGRAIRTADDVPRDVRGLAEPLGHGIGLKDANVTSDIFEAYALLATVVPDRVVRDRLDELVQLSVHRLVTVDGAMHYMTYADWSAVPTLERFGYPLQFAFRLLIAAHAPGLPLPVDEVSRRLVGHVLERGWDDGKGGVLLAGPSAEPRSIDGYRLRIGQLEWWSQAEAMRMLTLLIVRHEQPERYRGFLDAVLRTTAKHFLDGRHGGWHQRPLADTPLRRRLRGEPYKGNRWKDASHEADAYLMLLRMLRGLPVDSPLE